MHGHLFADDVPGADRQPRRLAPDGSADCGAEPSTANGWTTTVLPDLGVAVDHHMGHQPHDP